MHSEGYCSCLCVCVCVCPLIDISPLERLFVLKTIPRTQRTTKVKRFVWISLKPLRCRDPALPPLYGHAYSRPFFSCTRMIHRRGFSTLVLFIENAVPSYPQDAYPTKLYQELFIISKSCHTNTANDHTPTRGRATFIHMH